MSGPSKYLKHVSVVVSAHARPPSPYAPLAILATRNIALRFCRGGIVGACKLEGRTTVPLASDIRESDRRGEFTSPCTDGGRMGEPRLEVDRDRDGPIGGRTAKTSYVYQRQTKIYPRN